MIIILTIITITISNVLPLGANKQKAQSSSQVLIPLLQQ